MAIDVHTQRRSQGRSGVPLYIYYAPGKEPEILPQLLTVSRVVSVTSTGETA